jgi:hypothetical protein
MGSLGTVIVPVTLNLLLDHQHEPNVLKALEGCSPGDRRSGDNANDGEKPKHSIFHRSRLPGYQPLPTD